MKYQRENLSYSNKNIYNKAYKGKIIKKKYIC
jgi:hypothetical protein